MNYLMKLMALVAIVSLGSSIDLQAQKKEKKAKEKKPKKEFVWELPALTKNEDFDTYLLTCDTLYREINKYCENMAFYTVAPIIVIDENGDTLRDANGEIFKRYAVVDTTDNYRIRGTKEALLQLTDIILSGTNLLLDIANISLLTATATTALPELGAMNALTYAKYLKAGPKIVQMGTQEIKQIVESCKAQARAVKQLKNGFTESGELKNAQGDASNLEGLDIANIPPVVKSPQAYEEETAAAKAADAGIGDDKFDDMDF